MNNVQVSVILVNYNTKEMTEACIKSIIRETKDINYEIIVIDNASNDGSYNYLESMKDSFASLIVIKNEINRGFGSANNMGANIASGKYIFFLNTDTELKSNAIKDFYDFYENHHSKLVIGALGTWLTDVNGNINGYGDRFPTLFTSIKNNLTILFKHIPGIGFSNNKFDKIYNKVASVMEVEYVIGADIFIRKDIYDRVGGFDEDFFMYCEDSYLCWKLNKLGYKNYVFKGSHIVHYEQGSSKDIKKTSIRANRSRLMFFKKTTANNIYYKWKEMVYLFMIHTILRAKKFSKTYIKEFDREITP